MRQSSFQRHGNITYVRETDFEDVKIGIELDGVPGAPCHPTAPPMFPTNVRLSLVRWMTLVVCCRIPIACLVSGACFRPRSSC